MRGQNLMTSRRARRIRNLSRWTGRKKVLTKVRFCVLCPELKRRIT